MPSSSEIAKVMAEMDRFNKPVTVTEERYEKRVASVGGSYGGLTALLQQGAPGNWASDHKSEAEKFSGWHYVAITSIGKAVRSCEVEAYQEKVREYAKGYNEQDEDTTPLPKWHPLMKLLKRPNPNQSGASFREEMAIQLCLTGSALVWNVPNQMGRCVERYVIPTAIAEPRQPEKGLPKGGWYINPEVARWQIESGWFLYTGLAQAIGKVIDARDVQVVRFIHPVFKDEGQSPVSAGALWTDTSEKIDISRHAHLRNGSDPSVIIGIDGVEDEGTLQRMSAKFNEKYAGPSKHGKAMFVNGQNVKVEPVTRTPAEMAYEGAFSQFRDAIMALHGVTPIAAGIEAPSGDDGLYAPLKQFVVGTVQPILDLMAEEDTEQLAAQFGEGVSIHYTAKAIDDAKLTEQQINTDIAAGAIEVDEIRKLRGRKPWGGEKGKAVAGQGAKEEAKPGLPGLAQGVPGLEPQTGPQTLDPGKPPQGAPDPMKLAEEAVAKALGGFADRLSALLKSGDNCGTGAGGFQEGNTCGQRRAKKGGQVGMNGEFYAGGQFLPSTDMPKKVRADMARIASGKSKVDEGVYETLTPGEFAPYEMIGTFLEKAGRDSDGRLQVRASNDTALAYMGVDTQEKMGQLQSIINRFNAGERKLQIFDYPSFPSAKDIIRALNANLPIPESMLPRLQGNLSKYVTKNGEAADKLKSDSGYVKLQPGDAVTRELPGIVAKGSDCGANGPGGGGFQAGNTCGREDGSGEGDGGKESKKKPTKKGKAKGILAWAEDKFGDAEKAKNFADWAGDSVVLNEAGEPAVLYHGTGAQFEEFSDKSRGGVTDAKSAEMATFFTDDQATAKAYSVYASEDGPIKEQLNLAEKAEKRGDWDAYDRYLAEAERLDTSSGREELRKKARVMEVFLKGNFAEVDAGGKTPQELSDDGNIDSWLHDQLKKAKREGKDGVIFRNLDDAVGLSNRPATHYAIFNPSGKVKAANNQGTFDPKNPNIYKSADNCGANAEGGGGFQPGNTCARGDGSEGSDEPKGSGGSKPGKGSKVYDWALEKFKDEETARNFTEWFGDSKVVDEDGNPLVVYHGTSESFEEFDTSISLTEGRDRAAFFSDSSEVSDTYTSHQVLDEKQRISETTRALAELETEYSRLMGELPPERENAFIHYTNRAVENGEITREDYDRLHSLWERHQELDSYTLDEIQDYESKKKPQMKAVYLSLKNPKIINANGMGSSYIVPEALQGIDRTKYDGIIFRNIVDTGDGTDTESTVFAVFSPTAIKSATGNSGKFDPKDPNITKSGSDCGANAEGGGGFQPGNTCGREDGGEAEQVPDKKAVRDRKQKEKRTRERLYLEAELMRATGWTTEELYSKTEQFNSAGEIDAWMRGELDKRQTGVFAEARRAVKPELDKLRAKVVEVWEKDMDKISELNKQFAEEADKHDKLNRKHMDLYLAHREMRDSMGNSEREVAEYGRLGKEMDAAAKEAKAQGDVARKIWEKKNRIPDKTREKIAAVLRKESAKMAGEISPEFAEQFKLTEKNIEEWVKRDYALVIAGNSTEQDKKIRQKSLEFLATAANPEFHNQALKSAVNYKDGVRANANPGVNTERLGKLLDSGVPAKEAIFQSRVPSHSVFAPGDELRTYVHEMGHQIEFGSREAAEYANDFLSRRTSGDEVVSFAERFGAHYRPDERGSDDEFGKAIQSVFSSTYGKTSSDMLANYTGKIYSDGSTEILAVGLELFHENPKAFAEADPEWFDLVSGVLTGRVLKRTTESTKAKYQ